MSDENKKKAKKKQAKSPIETPAASAEEQLDLTENQVEFSSDKKESNGKEEKKHLKKRDLWFLKIAIISFFLAAFFSFLSELTGSLDNIIIIIILLLFLILASIMFDAIGVAVTSCDLAPLLSMASRKVYGAKTAIKLVKNAEKVANICCDVLGDIFGIVSGACSVVIVLAILKLMPNSSQQLLTILISSIVAAITIGGKAALKNVAINNSRELVFFVAKILAAFSKDERKAKKKK
ncbi:MAG: hypothetical protein GX891_02435 [Clostridiales bacterium]|nr:hypothetical protein [Clostridiales bacterium]